MAEIYRAIQGEGDAAGLACVLVRLAGCNLSCTWCDTTYAREGGGRPMEVEDVVGEIERFATPLVEVTGGEPLLQPDSILLMERLLALGHRVLLETNGSLDIAPVPSGVVRIVDVKCPASGESARNLLSNLDRLRADDEVKFVIADRRDYDWARGLVMERGLAGQARVVFTPASGRIDAAVLAGWILDEGPGARLGIQLHKIVWPEGEPR